MKFKTLNYVNVEADIVHITLEGGALFEYHMCTIAWPDRTISNELPI